MYLQHVLLFDRLRFYHYNIQLHLVCQIQESISVICFLNLSDNKSCSSYGTKLLDNRLYIFRDDGRITFCFQIFIGNLSSTRSWKGRSAFPAFEGTAITCIDVEPHEQHFLVRLYFYRWNTSHETASPPPPGTQQNDPVGWRSPVGSFPGLPNFGSPEFMLLKLGRIYTLKYGLIFFLYLVFYW